MAASVKKALLDGTSDFMDSEKAWDWLIKARRRTGAKDLILIVVVRDLKMKDVSSYVGVLFL